MGEQDLLSGGDHRLRIHVNLQDSDSHSDEVVEEHRTEDVGQSYKFRLSDQHSSTKAKRGPQRKKLSKTRPRRSISNEIGTHGSDDRNGIRGAADLLSKWIPLIFSDLCETCFQIVQERINGLASGKFSPFVGIETSDVFTGESHGHTNSFMSEFSPTVSGAVSVVTSRRASLDKDNRAGKNLKIGIRTNLDSISVNGSEGQNSTKQEVVADSAGNEEITEGSWQEVSEEFGNDIAGVLDRPLDSTGLDGSETSMADQEAESLDREVSSQQRTPLSREVREQIRLSRVERHKDFKFLEHVNGRIVNTVEGLELHKGIFSAVEQKRLVNVIYELQEKHQSNKFSGHSKNRVSIPLGQSYSHNLEVEPIPALLQTAIRRLVKWQVLPSNSFPDSCTAIIHGEGDTILPQFEHQSFLQPSCVLSLLSEGNMLFGYKLKALETGEIQGGFAISLPVGSVLVIKGSSADIAKHAMPAISSKRISVLFRKVSPKVLSGHQGQQGGLSDGGIVRSNESVKEKPMREFSFSTMSPPFETPTSSSIVLVAERSPFLNQDNAKSRQVINPATSRKDAASNRGNGNVQEVGDHRPSVVDDSAESRITIETSSGTSPSWADRAEAVNVQSSIEREHEENQFSRVTKEHVRFLQVGRKKDFICYERINGKEVNIVEGLELHTNVFNAEEQKMMVDYIYDLQEKGRRHELRDRTYSEPRKWMRGKGRVTIQFGCCYNYAVDKYGNPPGIIRDEEVDPIPERLRDIIKRLVRWHVLPRSCVPDSCIINLYDVSDCIPPHIDHHDFVRPFCTVSLLSECNIVFGANLKIIGPGDFEGSLSVPLPMGSVLVLNGNGADVAKHAVPAVPTKRISITFRKMDPLKAPYGFSPDPELISIRPLFHDGLPSSRMQETQSQLLRSSGLNAKGAVQTGTTLEVSRKKSHDWSSESSFFSMESDFPPLESSKSIEKQYLKSKGSRYA